MDAGEEPGVGISDVAGAGEAGGAVCEDECEIYLACGPWEEMTG